LQATLVAASSAVATSATTVVASPWSFVGAASAAAMVLTVLKVFQITGIHQALPSGPLARC
jgi:hypothetical protein